MGVYTFPSTDAVYPARDEDTDSPCSELHEEIAQGPRIMNREILLGFTV